MGISEALRRQLSASMQHAANNYGSQHSAAVTLMRVILQEMIFNKPV